MSASSSSSSAASDESFELFDLRVEVDCSQGGPILCGAKPGDYFTLEGEMLHLPDGQGFSIYSLAAVLPLLAAKQRESHENDWMHTDTQIACPDPHCKTRLTITRTKRRRFAHSETTVVPLNPKEEKKAESGGKS